MRFIGDINNKQNKEKRTRIHTRHEWEKAWRSEADYQNNMKFRKFCGSNFVRNDIFRFSIRRLQ